MQGIPVAAIILTILLSETFCISTSPVKNNSDVRLNFQCYQNSNPGQTCSSGVGYKDCYIILKLCIRDRQFKTFFSTLEECNILDKTYIIPNTRGICKRGKEDNRRSLKFINRFHSNLDMTYIYISVSIKPKIEDVGIHTEYYSFFNLTKGNQRFKMEHLHHKDKSNIRIQMNARVECLSDLSGEKCESFCVNNTNNYNCTIDQEKLCTKDWNDNTCRISDIKENLKMCCLSSTRNDKCEQYTKCLSDVLRCSNTSILSAHSCSKSENIPKYAKFFIKIATSGITYIIGGLLLIIVILLISLLQIWKKKKIIANIERRHEIIYKVSDTRNRFPLPNIPTELDNTDPQYSLCREMQRLNEEAAQSTDPYLEATARI